MASNVRDDYYIRSSLPKLKLAEFSGDPLEWPEWSQLFEATVHAANIDDSVKMNHRLLHQPYKNEEQIQNVENVDEVSNLSSMKSSGVLPVIPVTVGSGNKPLKTFALCDSGASLSFVDESLTKTLNLTGQPVDLNVAGIRGTSDISSKRLRVRIGDQEGKVNENIMAYSHPQRKCRKSNVQPQEIERNISSPVSFESLYHQLGRSESHLGSRLLPLA